MKTASLPPNFNPIRKINTDQFAISLANRIAERYGDVTWDFLPRADYLYYDVWHHDCKPIVKREFDSFAKIIDGKFDWKPEANNDNNLVMLMHAVMDLIIYGTARDEKNMYSWIRKYGVEKDPIAENKLVFAISDARLFEKLQRLSSFRELDKEWNRNADENEDGDRFANSRVASEYNPFAAIGPRTFSENLVKRLVEANTKMGKSKPPMFMVQDAVGELAKVYDFMVTRLPRKITEAMSESDFWTHDAEIRVRAGELEEAIVDTIMGKPATIKRWVDKHVSPKYQTIESEIRNWIGDLGSRAIGNHYWWEIERIWEEEEREYYQRMDHSRYLHRAAALKKEHPFRAISADLIAGNVADALIKTEGRARGEKLVAPRNLYFDLIRDFSVVVGEEITKAAAPLEKMPKKVTDMLDPRYLWNERVMRNTADLQTALGELIGFDEDNRLYDWANRSMRTQEGILAIDAFIQRLDTNGIRERLQALPSWERLLQLWEQEGEMMRYSNHVASQPTAGKGVKIDPRDITLQSTYISGYDDLRDLISDYDAGRVKNQNASSLLYLSVAGVDLEGRILVPPNLSKDMLMQFTKTVDGRSDELLETGKYLDEDSIKIDHYYGQYPDESSEDYYDISSSDIVIDYESADEENVLECAGEIKNFKALTAQLTKKMPSWATGKMSSPSGLYLTGDCEISYDMGDEYSCNFRQNFLDEDHDTAYIYAYIGVNPGKEKTKYCVEVSAADLQALQKKNKVASSPLRTMPDYGDESNTKVAAAEGAPMKRAKFEKGVPADPTVNMSPEDAAIWDEMNDRYGDMLKTARGTVRWKTAPSGRGFLYDTGMEVWNVRKDNMGDWYVATLEEDGTIWFSQDKYDNPDDAKAEAERRINAPFNGYAGMRKTARFEEGKPADPTIHMSSEDAEIWDEMNEKYGDMLKSAGRIVSREPYLRALERMSDAFQRSGGSHQKLYDAVSRRIDATKDPGKLLGIIDAIENDVLVGSFGTVPPHIEKQYTDLVKRVESKHSGRRVAAGNFSAFINSGEALRAVASVFRGATIDDEYGVITWENVTRRSGLQLIYRGGFYENGDVAFTLTLQQRQEIIELLNTTVSLKREKDFVQVLGGLHLALQKWKSGIADLAASL